MSELADILTRMVREGVRAALRGVRTGMPAVVVSYNPGTSSKAPTCDVQPVYTEDDGTELPVLPDRPILYPRGSVFAKQWPLSAGNHVWLAFSERSLDSWLAYGDKRPPGSSRQFDWSDAVVWPGFGPHCDPSPPFGASYPNDLVMGHIADDGLRIRITSDKKIWIGRVAPPPLTGDVELLDIIDRLMTAMKTMTFGPYPIDPTTLNALTGFISELSHLKT